VKDRTSLQKMKKRVASQNWDWKDIEGAADLRHREEKTRGKGVKRETGGGQRKMRPGEQGRISVAKNSVGLKRPLLLSEGRGGGKMGRGLFRQYLRFAVDVGGSIGWGENVGRKKVLKEKKVNETTGNRGKCPLSSVKKGGYRVSGATGGGEEREAGAEPEETRGKRREGRRLDVKKRKDGEGSLRNSAGKNFFRARQRVPRAEHRPCRTQQGVTSRRRGRQRTKCQITEALEEDGWPYSCRGREKHTEMPPECLLRGKEETRT